MSTEMFKDLFFDTKFSDVELRIDAVQSDKQLTFPAHSLVLKLTSDLFGTMLEYGKFKEGQTRIVELSVPGNEMDAVTLYRFIYKRELPDLDLPGYLALLQVAHLYQIASLMEICEDRISLNLSPYSVCRIAKTVKNISNALFQKCLSLMLRSAFLIFDKHFHLCLSEDIMKDLLISNYLNVVDEEQVVEAVWNWARVYASDRKEQVVIAQTAGQLLNFVRWNFVFMTNRTSPWFTTAQDRIHTRTKDFNRRASRFSHSLLPVSTTYDLVHRDISEATWNSEGTQKLTVFSVNRNIYISGFTLRAAYINECLGLNFPFYLKMNKVDVGNKTQCVLEFLSDREDCQKWYQIRVEFREPVKVENSCINVISIENRQIPIRRAAFVKSSDSMGCTKSSGAVKFNFEDEIIGICSISYFVRD